MEYIKSFIEYRNKYIDHQLFGSYTNHRDLLILYREDSERIDTDAVKGSFRDIYQKQLNDEDTSVL